MAKRILFRDGDIVWRDGNIVWVEEGEEDDCECCDTVDPFPCEGCTEGTIPGFVTLNVSGWSGGSCGNPSGCDDMNGTFICNQFQGFLGCGLRHIAYPFPGQAVCPGDFLLFMGWQVIFVPLFPGLRIDAYTIEGPIGAAVSPWASSPNLPSSNCHGLGAVTLSNVSPAQPYWGCQFAGPGGASLSVIVP